MTSPVSRFLAGAAARPLLALLALLPAATAGAAVLLQTGFDTGYSLGSINGQSGGVNDTGFAGSWVTTTEGNFSVVSGGLSYSVSGGGVIGGGANSLQYGYGTAASAQNPLSANISAIGQNEIYVRFLVQQVTPASGGNGYMFLWMDSNNTTNHLSNDPGAGVYAQTLAAQVGGTSSRTTGVSLSNSVTHLVVAKFTKTGSQYETVDLWLDPGFGQSSTPTASISSTNGALSSATYLGIAFNNLNNGTDYRFDGLVIGTTWADVVPGAVPEPSAYAAMAGAGALALVALRRRRR